MWKQRALHRVRELLLLLVQTRVVDRERGLAGDRPRLVDDLRRDRRFRSHGKNRQRRQHLGGRRDRNGSSRPAVLEERDQRRGRKADLLHRPRRQGERLPETEEPLERARAKRPGMREDGTSRLLDARLRDLQRARNEPFPPLVGQADERDVHVEHVHDRARQGVEGRVE